MKKPMLIMVGLLLSLQTLSPARSPQNADIPLTRSGPIMATHDGQVIQNKLIHVTQSDGVQVVGKKKVTIRQCRIAYGVGHQGIRFSQAPGLRIEDCEIVCHNAPKAGKIEAHNSNCISGYESDNVSIERVKMSDGSAGIYLLICDNSTVRTVEGHNFRGNFPRGQFIQ
ncbi:MAG: right-handed parallel beta-helix repeat-containing protein, partial [Planctomycetes bacterium]|nr:right-handed parallel beta-helix repeat-containing protein [Planctomycetota bacterium]